MDQYKTLIEDYCHSNYHHYFYSRSVLRAGVEWARFDTPFTMIVYNRSLVLAKVNLSLFFPFFFFSFSESNVFPIFSSPLVLVSGGELSMQFIFETSVDPS
jgi:hypothetical protein